MLGTSIIAAGFYFYIDAKLSKLPDSQSIKELIEEKLPEKPGAELSIREKGAGGPQRLPF